MSEISEGDFVVTPEGRIDGKLSFCEGGNIPLNNQKTLKEDGATWEKYNLQDAVKIDQPLRIKVDSEWQAEALVSLAEKNGWSPFVQSIAERKPVMWDDEMCIHLALQDDKLLDLDPCQPHEPILDFADDLPQIEAWIEAHSESGPDCTDDDSYFEPQPEDEEWREMLFHAIAGGLMEENMQNLGMEGMVKEDTILLLLDELDSTKQELSDCWENQQEYKNDVANLHERVAKLREELDEVRHKNDCLVRGLASTTEDKFELEERIEEARDYIKKNVVTNKTIREELLKILSDDKEDDKVTENDCTVGNRYAVNEVSKTGNTDNDLENSE